MAMVSMCARRAWPSDDHSPVLARCSQVFLCCTLFSLAVFSGTVAADGSFKATLKGDKLKVTGEKGHVEYEGSFPTKECKKACKETCEKKEVETCTPVVVHKCKNVPKIIKVGQARSPGYFHVVQRATTE